MPLKPVETKNFTTGLVTRLEQESIPRGAASDSLNWITEGDRITLRRGVALVGSNVAGTGKITGLHKGSRFDGTQVLFASYRRKFNYYDEVTSDFIEIGSDTLPEAADGEDVSFASYHSLAGAAVYASSPNSSIYKFMVANPGSVTDLQSETYRGKIKINKGTMFLWDRNDVIGGSDKTGLYRSWGDKDQLSDHTHVTKEDVGNGDGSTTNITGTLAFKAAGAKRTCMYALIAAPVVAGTSISAITKATQAVVTSTSHGLAVGDFVIIEGGDMTEIIGTIARVTAVSGNDVTLNVDSTSFTTYTSGGTIYKAERFVDDRNGTLSSPEGGTGTINYTTGAFDITFNTAPINTTNVWADYYWEDSTNNDAGTGNSGAIADFTFSTSRTANEGLALRQDDGGAAFQNMGTIVGSEYCLHTNKTYKLDIAADDTTITNLIFRNKVGIENWRAMAETGDGIYYIDSQDIDEPAVRILEPSQFSNEIIPASISENLILSDYRFDRAVVFEFGKVIIVECRTINSPVNDTTFMYHKVWKAWDRLDFRASCYAEYEGDLYYGDDASTNVFKAFDGVTDEDALIDNYWISKDDNLDVEGVKVVNKLIVGGLIQVDQELEIDVSYDGGDFVNIGSIVGDASYVDRGSKFYIGANGIGTQPIGLGGTGIEVAPFRREMRINTPKFEMLRIRFRAINFGIVSVSEYTFKDVRLRGRTLPTQYLVS